MQVYPPQAQMYDVNTQPQYMQQGMQQQPYGYPPNQLPNQPVQPPMFNQNQAQAQIDVAIANNFGDMFFNMNDPQIAKTNVPIKQDSSMHTAVVIGTILYIAGIVVGAIGFGKFLVAYSTALVIVLPYICYLVCAIVMSDIRAYITNLKRFD